MVQTWTVPPDQSDHGSASSSSPFSSPSSSSNEDFGADPTKTATYKIRTRTQDDPMAVSPLQLRMSSTRHWTETLPNRNGEATYRQRETDTATRIRRRVDENAPPLFTSMSGVEGRRPTSTLRGAFERIVLDEPIDTTNPSRRFMAKGSKRVVFDHLPQSPREDAQPDFGVARSPTPKPKAPRSWGQKAKVDSKWLSHHIDLPPPPEAPLESRPQRLVQDVDALDYENALESEWDPSGSIQISTSPRLRNYPSAPPTSGMSLALKRLENVESQMRKEQGVLQLRAANANVDKHRESDVKAEDADMEGQKATEIPRILAGRKRQHFATKAKEMLVEPTTDPKRQAMGTEIIPSTLPQSPRHEASPSKPLLLEESNNPSTENAHKYDGLPQKNPPYANHPSEPPTTLTNDTKLATSTSRYYPASSKDPSKGHVPATQVMPTKRKIVNTATPASAAQDVRQILEEIVAETGGVDSEDAPLMAQTSGKLLNVLASIKDSKKEIESMEHNVTVTVPVAPIDNAPIYVMIRLPRLWRVTCESWKGWELTWLGLILMLLTAWALLEDQACASYCRVDTLGYWETVPYDAPNFGHALPYIVKKGLAWLGSLLTS
jgi:hypothetical protein